MRTIHLRVVELERNGHHLNGYKHEEEPVTYRIAFFNEKVKRMTSNYREYVPQQAGSTLEYSTVLRDQHKLYFSHGTEGL